jgi:hypothetical protein
VIKALPDALLALLILATAAVLLLCQLQFFGLFHPHLPVRDTFRILDLVEQVSATGIMSIPLADWLELHAGAHRIVLTRLLMVLDYQHLGGRNHLLFASTGLGLALLLGLYSRAARDLAGRRLWPTLLYTGLAACFLFSPSLWWNLVSPINASWYCAIGFSAAAFWLALNYRGDSDHWRPWLALACALLAACSNFAGVLCWPLLPVALALRRTGAVWWTAALCLACFYLFLPAFSTSVGTPTGMAGWSALLSNTATYLGSPLNRQLPTVVMVCSAASVMLLASAWLGQWQAQRRREAPASTAALWALLMATLCLGIAVATQLGRTVYLQPDSLRYQVVVMVYWLNILLLLPQYLRPAPLAHAILTLLIALLVLWPLQQPLPREWQSLRASLTVETLAQSGLPPRKSYAALLPLHAGDPLRSHAAFLQQRQLALYHPDARHPDHCALRLWREMRGGDATGARLLQQLASGPCPRADVEDAR